jgi:peptidoglycan hydrolase CwlO-like protein
MRPVTAVTSRPDQEGSKMSGFEDGTLHKQIDTLQKQVKDLKHSADHARKETSEQVEARITEVKADIGARSEAVRDKTAQAADRAESHWEAAKAEAAAKIRDLQGRIDRKRDQRDVKKAEEEAVAAELDANDAVAFASWAVDQAHLAVLDAIDARAWADERAAASPSH